MTENKYHIYISIMLAFALCMTQVIGSSILILGVLGLYLVFLGWCCSSNCTMPILLFFLPWSTIMRLSPSSYSFYTFGIILVCAISLVRQKFILKCYHLITGILLVLLTLLSKLLDGSSLSFDYIAFIMLIVLFPVVKEEWKIGNYSFFHMVLFFSFGIVMAALCAKAFALSHNISRYITVHSYHTITRMCGFYGDPNFYTAQITAALSGTLLMLLHQRKKSRFITLAVLTALLIYCGFLSGSKSFVLVSGLILLLWLVELARVKGRPGLKVLIVFMCIAMTWYIATSTLFRDLIQILATRLSASSDMSAFTTGRTELWASYFDALFHDPKLLLLGKGFTNEKINGRASHNTLIQMIFQFGLIGIPVLLTWSICFFRDRGKAAASRKDRWGVWILLVGSFLPWMAIDALFFDEFFLLQMYVFLGIQQLHFPQNEIKSNYNGKKPSASLKRRRIQYE